MCLLGRRLVERGVRFVQLYHGSGSKWDAHRRIETNHADNCRGSDKPVAGLLKDLKRRGLLDSTLVIWGGEFGRTPQSEAETVHPERTPRLGIHKAVHETLMAAPDRWQVVSDREHGSLLVFRRVNLPPRLS
jgi:hypothetical protein